MLLYLMAGRNRRKQKVYLQNLRRPEAVAAPGGRGEVEVLLGRLIEQGTGYWAKVGAANVADRSFQRNYKVNAVRCDPTLAAETGRGGSSRQ